MGSYGQSLSAHKARTTHTAAAHQISPYNSSRPPARPVPGVADGDLKNDASVKPALSYAMLISNAINSGPGRKLTLNGIYAHIKDNYAYYRAAEPTGWQVG